MLIFDTFEYESGSINSDNLFPEVIEFINTLSGDDYFEYGIKCKLMNGDNVVINNSFYLKNNRNYYYLILVKNKFLTITDVAIVIMKAVVLWNNNNFLNISRTIDTSINNYMYYFDNLHNADDIKIHKLIKSKENINNLPVYEVIVHNKK